MEGLPDEHGLDAFGEHNEETCYACLLGKEVKSECRCGKCCRLIVEVELEDAEREPRIREKGVPIYTDAPLTGSGQRALAGYILNVKENDFACAFLDQRTNLCTIYETRPLICRLFDCDGEGREQLVESGWVQRGGEAESACGPSESLDQVRKPVQRQLFDEE